MTIIVHGIHVSFNSPVRYSQIDDTNFFIENGVIGIQPWVLQLPEYAGMSRNENRQAIAAGGIQRQFHRKDKKLSFPVINYL